MKILKNKRIIETFNVHPEQGIVSMALGFVKEGYKLIKIDRKLDKCKVTYEKL